MRLTEFASPKTFSDIVGQEDLLNSPKYSIIYKGNFDILILYGPTGTGKSSFARILGEHFCAPFYPLHASTAGNSEIKKIIDTAKKTGKPPIIFIDEIHRFSKVQQDLLLDVVDEKYARIVGASTENPFYSLTPAIRSRGYFVKFKALTDVSLSRIAERVIKIYLEHRGLTKLSNLKEVIDSAVQCSNGDARKLINFIEASLETGDLSGLEIKGNLEVKDLVFGESYDVDQHYDILSAMIKSIRGSDPDAALVWCFKLLKSGVDPKVIFRRLAISCSEDIGNALPDAAVVLSSLWDLFEKVGMPEGEIIIAQAVTFLSSCPKSNRTYEACKSVKKYLTTNDPKVPANIVSNSKSYKYPFDHGNFVLQKYLNEDVVFYNPSNYGFEKKILD
ncbi:MAG: AAA family ATPase, partial [Calditerrivibrio sp.]|nr:AAA family ATPase [Calditerrivibrio sp.]